jgi:hypothetical protein
MRLASINTKWETTPKVSSQKSRTFHGSRPQTMGRAWSQTASKIRAADKDLSVQVLRTIKKEVILCQECGSMFT